MNVKSRYLKIVAGASLALVLAGSIFYFNQVSQGPIVDFVYERDAQAMLKIFKDNWYWLFPGPDYSPDYILRHRSPGREPSRAAYRGKLHIKVLRENNDVAGFTTYYKENFYRGRVQFVAVSLTFRKKGYGRLLSDHAVKQLFALGCRKVILTTRINNHKALRIYERIGFKETSRDDEYGLIDFAISRKDFKK